LIEVHTPDMCDDDDDGLDAVDVRRRAGRIWRPLDVLGREPRERVLDGVRVFQEAVGVGDAALWAVHLVDRPRSRGDGEQRGEYFHHAGCTLLLVRDLRASPEAAVAAAVLNLKKELFPPIASIDTGWDSTQSRLHLSAVLQIFARDDRRLRPGKVDEASNETLPTTN
jgi:hypothetical protein